MKKLFLLLAILVTVVTISYSQTNQKFDFKVRTAVSHTVDLTVLTATTAYWIYDEKPQADKIIHFLFGYISTQAMYYILEPLDLPKFMKAFTPVFVFGGLALFKEVMLDGSPDWGDFKAGMYGCGISVVSFNLIYRF